MTKIIWIIAIRCSNCGKQTGLSMDDMNTNYKDIVTVFLMNILLHHAGMLWIIETHGQLKYYMEKHNPDLITCGPCYTTHIWKKIHGTVFESFIDNAKTDRCNLKCYTCAHEKQQP